MKGEDEDTAHELVLIRRRSGGEDAPHKGGVWKIAYADFMTAMMAFFLVMWLINSTDQRVLTQVANYFNPMRLTDNTPHARGVNTIESGEQGKQGKQSSVGDPKDKHHANETPVESKAERSSKGKASEADEGDQSATARYSEQALFSDPFGVLARIAAQAPKDIAVAAESKAQSGEAFRDPFEGSAPQPGGKRSPAPEPNTKEITGRANQNDGTQPDTGPAPAAAPEADRQPGPAANKAGVTAPDQQAVAPAETKAQEDARKIEREIGKLAAELKGVVPNLNARVTDEGILISVTDDLNFGMFAIASAEPRPALVAVMERIAGIVKQYPNPITVRGHTDARPYRAGTSDNWRLSTARAHMAYYMLVRGGVDEKRFDRIEGYADRTLRIPNEPEAAQNRRIEILLRRPER